ncbi:glutamine-rich protein 2-like isoform x2 [Plakobranchus ocellatus]|uniref:Glutamine-rich protein 2-like isoform x2 n=1 Tax=Plakobranchus ocellatus TaxID=259542 RepID=A0AAV4C7I8_9GAST|nr:glutamine-rich protein 2-like isoform x2 [Plakobranchus ocellatus]
MEGFGINFTLGVSWNPTVAARDVTITNPHASLSQKLSTLPGLFALQIDTFSKTLRRVTRSYTNPQRVGPRYTELHRPTADCAEIHRAAPTLCELRRVTPSCTDLQQIAPRYTELHRPTADCAEIHRAAPTLCELRRDTPSYTDAQRVSP